MSVIYGVVKNGSIIYVGQTSDLASRTTQHRARFGDEIMCTVLHYLRPSDNPDFYENFWIGLGEMAGWPLCNFDSTTEGYIVHPDAYTDPSFLASSLGTPRQRILTRLESGPATKTELFGVLHNKINTTQLNAILAELVADNKVSIIQKYSGGRPSTVVQLVTNPDSQST